MACGKKKMALGGSTPGDPLDGGCKGGKCKVKTPPTGKKQKPAMFQRTGGGGFSKPKHKSLF